MKKIFSTFILVSISTTVLAYTTEDLNANAYYCNSKRISYNSTESMIKANCANYHVKYSQQVVSGQSADDTYHNQPTVDDENQDINLLAKVKFTTDNGTRMECFYRQSKLYKCKAKVKKPTASK